MIARTQIYKDYRERGKQRPQRSDHLPSDYDTMAVHTERPKEAPESKGALPTAAWYTKLPDALVAAADSLTEGVLLATLLKVAYLKRSTSLVLSCDILAGHLKLKDRHTVMAYLADAEEKGYIHIGRETGKPSIYRLDIPRLEALMGHAVTEYYPDWKIEE